MTTIKNTQGFSLIEVLIAVSIGVVVMLALASMFSNMNKSTNSVSFRTNSDVLNEEIRALLSSEPACVNSFGTLSADAASNHTILQIRDSANTPRYVAPNGLYGDRTVTLNEMRLAEFLPGSTPLTGEMTLTLRLTSAREASGPTEILRRIKISLERDAANNITSCRALAKMSDGIWQRTPTNINNISFIAPTTGGRVGIGTLDPEATLEVVGGARVWTEGRWAIHDGYTYSNSFQHNSMFVGMRARGTKAAPAYPRANDHLGGFTGRDAIDGYNATSYGGSTVLVEAEEDFSATAKGSRMIFSTTNLGTNTESAKMIITSGGNIGIGTMAPAARLDVKGGKIRGEMDCRYVVGPPGYSGSTASCAVDEYVMSGGGECETLPSANPGFLHHSRPLSDLKGWYADCYRFNYAGTDVTSVAYAICCKK